MSKEIQIFPINENIDIYSFKIGKLFKLAVLGEGTFSKVLLVEKESKTADEDSNRFAIKINKKFALEGSERPDDLSFMEIRLINIMAEIHHPNLVHLIDIDFSNEDGETRILMNYLPTDLKRFFQENKDNQNVMNEKFFKNIAFQILSGVYYLHEKKFIHRDLKLENLLYDSKKNNVQICGFGLSRRIGNEINTKLTEVGTSPYMPPEVILGSLNYSTEFDIWSVGCILVEICTGDILFNSKNSLGLIKEMFKIFGSFNEVLLPDIENLPLFKLLKNIPASKGIGLTNYIKSKKKFNFENDSFFDLIEKMLDVNKYNRITAKDCLIHIYFSEFNCNGVIE